MSCWVLKNKNTGKLVFSFAENYKQLEEKLEKTEIPFEIIGIAEDFDGKITLTCQFCDQEFKIWKFENETNCPYCGKKQNICFE